MVHQQSDAYESVWDGLRSLNQKALLKGIAVEGHPSYSPDFIVKYGLKSQSHMQKSLTLLRDRGILHEEGGFRDTLLRQWILRRVIRGIRVGK